MNVSTIIRDHASTPVDVRRTLAPIDRVSASPIWSSRVDVSTLSDPIREFLEGEGSCVGPMPGSPSMLVDEFTRFCRSEAEAFQGLGLRGTDVSSGIGEDAPHAGDSIAVYLLEHADGVLARPIEGERHMGEAIGERLKGDHHRSLVGRHVFRVFHAISVPVLAPLTAVRRAARSIFRSGRRGKS